MSKVEKVKEYVGAEWSVIKDYSNYAVNREGVVMNIKHQRIMNHGFRDNRVNVRLIKGIKQPISNRVNLARLVAFAFTDPSTPFYGCKVGYLDGDVHNCHVDNLSWYKAGYADRSPEALSEPFSNGTTKLNDEKVKEIIELLKAGETSKRNIATMYGVSVSSIRLIAKNNTWKHIIREPI